MARIKDLIPNPQTIFVKEEWKKHQAFLSKTYHLITPMFGGGEEVNRADSVTVVRPSSIKGQLRFWWRALRGWLSKGDVGKLLAIEEAIWGGVTKSEKASPVRLEVELVDPSSPKELKHYDVNNAPRYVAFPLLQGDGEHDAALSEKITFKLKLTWERPEQKVKVGDLTLNLTEEMLAALWGWETFGGVGARTRRGFGAFTVEDAAYSENLQSFIESNLEHLNKCSSLSKDNIATCLKVLTQPQENNLPRPEWPKDVPHLSHKSAINVLNLGWKEVIDLYQRFRQYRLLDEAKPNRQNPNIPGPNKWPEAELVLWALAPKFYRDKKSSSKPAILAVPRAQFGLPVPFHYQFGPLKRRKDIKITGDPKQEIDRLASPLIIRPMAENKTLVAILHGPRKPRGGVYLTPEPKVNELKNQALSLKLNEKMAEELIKRGLRVLEILKKKNLNYLDPVAAFFDCIGDLECSRHLKEEIFLR